jgi:hypothetical protein
MDQASQDTIKFLSALQQTHVPLLHIWNSYTRRGVKLVTKFQHMSGTRSDPSSEILGTILLGIVVELRNGNEFDMPIKISWDTQKWIIQTEVWIELDDDQELIKAFPKKYSETLDECLSNLQIALQELASCEDLVFNYEK